MLTYILVFFKLIPFHYAKDVEHLTGNQLVKSSSGWDLSMKNFNVPSRGAL